MGQQRGEDERGVVNDKLCQISLQFREGEQRGWQFLTMLLKEFNSQQLGFALPHLGDGEEN